MHRPNWSFTLINCSLSQNRETWRNNKHMQARASAWRETQAPASACGQLLPPAGTCLGVKHRNEESAQLSQTKINRSTFHVGGNYITRDKQVTEGNDSKQYGFRAHPYGWSKTLAEFQGSRLDIWTLIWLAQWQQGLSSLCHWLAELGRVHLPHWLLLTIPYPPHRR